MDREDLPGQLFMAVYLLSDAVAPMLGPVGADGPQHLRNMSMPLRRCIAGARACRFLCASRYAASSGQRCWERGLPWRNSGAFLSQGECRRPGPTFRQCHRNAAKHRPAHGRTRRHFPRSAYSNPTAPMRVLAPPLELEHRRLLEIWAVPLVTSPISVLSQSPWADYVAGLPSQSCMLRQQGASSIAALPSGAASVALLSLYG